MLGFRGFRSPICGALKGRAGGPRGPGREGQSGGVDWVRVGEGTEEIEEGKGVGGRREGGITYETECRLECR